MPVEEGVVFNIQRFSVHDGPGIRTVVFLKGCPLHCLWCSNPESQRREVEAAFQAKRCLGLARCGLCQKERPEIAAAGDLPAFPRDAVTRCAVAELCPAQAFHIYGRRMTVSDVLAEVEKDEPFYARSGGGLTLSGGEPLAQPEFALALLREAKRRCIRTAIETSGAVPWEVLREAAGALDYVFFDLKLWNDERHRHFTGVPAAPIRENLARLVEYAPLLTIHVRTPVIPGVNDTAEEIDRIAAFVAQWPRVRYELLPYHEYGRPKYTAIGRKYPLGERKLAPGKMEELAGVLTRYPLGSL